MSNPAPHPVSSTAEASQPAQAINTPSVDSASPAAHTQAQKPAKEKKVKKGGDGLSSAMNALELDPKPEFMAHRMAMFDKIKKEYDDKVAGTFSV